jgi:transcriptional regulator with XRE-family HTH domain
MAGTISDTPRSRLLGAELRRQRIDRFKGSLRAFADEIGYNHSLLSKWERGEVLPSLEQVANIIGKLGIVGEERDYILEMARAARNPDWLTPGVDRQVSALIEFDRIATRMVSVAPLFTPGILHTEEVARVVLANSGFDDEQNDRIVTTRMGRKEALLREDPLRYEAYLGMRAITRPLGGQTVHLNQLRYIEKMSALDNVTVRAINETDDFTPADMGAFVLYELPAGDPIVYFEHHRSSMFAPKKDLPAMVQAVERVEEVAMSPDATSRLIADVIREMETTQ